MNPLERALGAPPEDRTDDLSVAYHVLLVEDDAGDARLLQAAFESATDSRYSIEHVVRLVDAIGRLDAGGVDVVLLDLGLPDSTGIETFSDLQALHPDVPIIVLTGLEDDHLALHAVHAGAQDYVVKGSLHEHQLVRVVRHAIERHGLAVALERLAQQQGALADLSRQAIEDASVDDLLRTACEQLAATLEAPVAVIVEHLDDGRASIRHAIGFPEDLVGHGAPPAPIGLPIEAAGPLAPLVIEDLKALDIPVPPSPFEDLRSGIVVGLDTGAFHGRLAVLDRKPRRFDTGEIAFVTATASVLSESIRRGLAERDLGERVKELSTLAAVSRLSQQPIGVAELVARVAPTLKAGMQWPQHAIATVRIDDHVASAGGQPTDVVEFLQAPIEVAGELRGEVAVGHADTLGFLLPYEQQLVDSIAETLATWVERNDAVVALAEREERLRTLMETAPVAITFVDADGRITFANPAAERTLGLSRDLVQQRTYDDPSFTITAADGSPFPADELPFEQVRTTGAPVAGVEHAVAWPDGTRRLLSVHGAPLHQPDGSFAGMVGAFVDVTDQRRTERALEESRQRLQGLFDNALDAIVLFDDQGHYIDVNPAACELTGYTRDELLGEHLGKLTDDPAHGASMLIELRNVGALSRPLRLKHKDGHLLETDLRAVADIVPGLHAEIIRDVTDQRRAERQLRDNEERLRTLVDQLPGVVWTAAPDGSITSWEGAASHELGLTHEELTQTGVQDLMSPEAYERLADATVAALAGEPQDLELAEDGRWWRTSLRPLRDGARVAGVIGLSLDVTEEVAARRAQRATEARLRFVLENMPGIVWLVDRDLQVVSHLGLGHAAIGVEPDSLVGTDAVAFMGEGSPGVAAARAAIERGEATLYEEEVLGRWWETHAQPLRDLDGEIVGAIGLGLDVTVTKDAERELDASRQRLQGLFDNSLDAIMLADDEGCYLDVNPAACELTGYTREELLGLSVQDVTAAAARAQAPQAWAAFLDAGEGEGEYPMQRRDGSVVETEFRAVANIVPGVHLSTMRDVSDRKRAEEELRRSEERFRSLVQNAAETIVLLDAEATIRWASPAIADILGVAVDDVVGVDGFQLVHPDDEPRMREFWERAVTSAEPLSPEAYRVQRADGTWRWIEQTVTNLTTDPAVGAMVLNARDVTERHEAELALRESEERFRRLAENADDFIFRLRLGDDFGFEYVSPAFEDLTGLPPQALYDQPLLALELLHPDDRERLAPDFVSPRGLDSPLEMRWRRTDGSYVWLEERHVNVHDETGRLVATEGIVRDVTARREAEQRLRQALEREQQAADDLRQLDDMKSTFLSAVSHELRTPLTSVVGFSQVLEKRHDSLPPERMRHLLGRLTENAERLQRLLENLLDVDRLTRGALAPDLAEVDVGALVLHTLEDLDLNSHRVNMAVEPVVARLDGPKIERIVENLVANAVRHTPSNTRIWVRLGPHDGGVLLAVEDEGDGVPDHLKHAIFEPFQLGDTDAAKVGGTGIGLTIVARFAELHGGRAWVEDRDEGGAVFRVWLPSDPG